MKNNKILYIDDSEQNLELFRDNFSDDFSVFTDKSSMDALSLIDRLGPDLLILDVHMPFKSGLELFEELKLNKELANTPVMFYSNDDSDETVNEGLSLGPEDFLLRSMSTSQIKSRIINRLQKVKTGSMPLELIKFENLTLNPHNLSVTIDTYTKQLTSIEYKILLFILKNACEKLACKSKLVEFVWGDMSVDSRTVNTHMSNLRSKIKPANFEIKTNRSNQIRAVKLEIKSL